MICTWPSCKHTSRLQCSTYFMEPHDPVGPAPDLAAEVIRLRAEIAELVAANTRLVVRLEKARAMGQQLVDDGECGYEITHRWHTWLTGKDE